MRCPKSRFSIRIIVFNELELIIFVSQGLTLLTASLVCIQILCKSGQDLTLSTVGLMVFFVKVSKIVENLNKIPGHSLSTMLMVSFK